MRAIVISKPGGPEVLQLRELPTPEPSRGEVRVRVRATAVNRADLLQRLGRYPPPLGASRDVPGLEIAGEVDSVGDGVEDIAIGDRVFGVVGGGGYAEYIVAHARTLARIPRELPFTQAAAVPEAFVTAWDAMIDQGHLQAGEAVLIHAVGSGVGTAAVQIARVIGALSLGTARSPDKLTRARELGLDHGILTTGGSFADEVRTRLEGRGPDVILELVGGSYLAGDLACVAPKGRIIVVGLLGGASAPVDLGVLMHKRATLRGTMLRTRPLEEKIVAANALGRNLAPLFARGMLCPIVHTILPLDQAGEAHRIVASDATFGKVVLEVP